MCGDTKLSQAVTPINIVCYDIDNATSRIWSTRDAKSDSKKDFYLKDAVKASISYPGTFDSKVNICAFTASFVVLWIYLVMSGAL